MHFINQFHLAVSPGEAFGHSCEGYFQIFLGVGIDTMNKAVKRLKNFLSYNY